MAYLYGSGNETVDRMTSFGITGNVIPQSWYRTILKKTTRKPYLLAISILADIVYWYRPQEVRDESTGQLLRYQKRFSGEMVQKSYSMYAELFGEDKQTITRAFDTLEDYGVIRRHFRNIKSATATMTNVMYVELDVDILHQLTYPEEHPSLEPPTPTKEYPPVEPPTPTREYPPGGGLPIGSDVSENVEHFPAESYPQSENPESLKPAENKGFSKISEQDPPMGSNLTPPTINSDTPWGQNRHPLGSKLTPPGIKFDGTYTKNTTENTTEITTQTTSFSPPVFLSDLIAHARARTNRGQVNTWEREIKRQIRYDALREEFIYSANALNKAIRLIAETLAMDVPPDTTIMINNQQYPFSLMLLRFKQATEHTFRTALSRVRVGVDRKDDMIAALYCAPLHFPSR